VQDDIEIGLVYSFHSDSPVTPVQPLLYAQTAATRTMYKKSTDDVLGRSQRITVIEALRGITTNAAKHVMLEDHIGSLEEGKSADMVVLGCDPTKVDALCLASIPIHGTWLKGKKVW
jgi:predicted amidohydrolase YtcJ